VHDGRHARRQRSRQSLRSSIVVVSLILLGFQYWATLDTDGKRAFLIRHMFQVKVPTRDTPVITVWGGLT
jgi:hypothetical protein